MKENIISDKIAGVYDDFNAYSQRHQKKRISGNSPLSGFKIELNEAKKGDKAHFSQIYSNYFEPVYRYIFLRIGNKAEADNLVQDVFLKIYEMPEESEDRADSAITQFYSVARKIVAEWEKRRKRSILRHSETDDFSDAHFSDDDDYPSKKDDFISIRDAIKNLKDEHQDVIILKFIENLPDNETAIIMGKQESLVCSLASQGLRIIRDILKNEYEK